MTRLNFLKTILDEFSRQGDKYRKIVKEGNKDHSIYFAIKSIVFSVLAPLTLLLIIMLFKSAMNSSNVIYMIFIIIFSLAFLIAVLLFVIYSFAAMINQFRLNKKLMSFIALLMFLVSLIGIVVVLLTLL